MSKLKLVANPTFSSTVLIPVAGASPVAAVFTFKHRTKAALDEFIASRADKSDGESFKAMVQAWDLECEFNDENIDLLLQNYIGSALATYRSYIDELVQAKTKN